MKIHPSRFGNPKMRIVVFVPIRFLRIPDRTHDKAAPRGIEATTSENSEIFK
jgi:hypothetical protein